MRYEQPIEARVFGEWMTGHEPLPALVVGDWNGWAVPKFNREAAERVVEAQKVLAKEWGDDGIQTTLAWDGDVILVEDHENECTDRIEADEDGYYLLDLGWCWEIAEAEHDPDQATEAQVAAQKRLAESLNCLSMNRTVAPDGSAIFPVHADLGNKASDGTTPLHETIARIRIDRDGNVTLEACDESR